MTKILVVDDEKNIIEVIETYLLNEGFEVFTSTTGTKALELFESEKPDLIILDLMLPDISGEEICKKIRKVSDVPVIMLTAKSQETYKIDGFKLGADDYVTKPFSTKELVFRVLAVLKRYKKINENIISFNSGELVIDVEGRRVLLNKEDINLTPSEFDILLMFAKYPRKVFTREEIINSALGDEYTGFDRIIDTHIKNVRHKMKEDKKKQKYIVTVHGVGYRFGETNDRN